MKSKDEFILGGKDITYNNLIKKVEKIKKQKICGNCVHFISHRRDKNGFEGKCKEIIDKENMTDFLTYINLTKKDLACKYFELKVKEVKDI